MESVAKLSETGAGVRNVGAAFEALLKFIDEHKQSRCDHEEGFEAFEREVRKRFSEAEREFVGEELERLDVALPEIVIKGVRHRRVVSGYGDYMTAAGPVSVLQHPTELRRNAPQAPWTNDLL